MKEFDGLRSRATSSLPTCPRTEHTRPGEQVTHPSYRRLDIGGTWDLCTIAANGP
jgi:hypothetical protein